MSDSTFQDRFLIRELYGRFALASATRDIDAWIGAWADDAAWKTPHFEVSGHAALREMWDATWVNFSKVAAFYEVGDVRVSGDSAEGIASVYEIITLASGGTLKMAGIYRDHYERRDGKWKFTRRAYETLSQEAASA